MLVKIKSENGRWILFDNAEQVEFDTASRLITSREELTKIGPDDGGASVTFILPGLNKNEISVDCPLYVSVIWFLRNQKSHVVVFNTLAYLCNDSGKTVEKVSVHAH